MYSLNEWLKEIKKSKKLIVVEGKKDELALKKLGIINTIKISNTPFYKTIEDISKKAKEVIILTDLDPEGRKFYSKLKHHLQKRGIKVDRIFREFLFKHTQLTNIEGINNYFCRTSYTESKIGFPVSKL